MRLNSVVNRFIIGAKYSKKIIVCGSGEQTRPFIYIKNLISIIKHGLLNEMKSGLYNVVDDTLKVKEVVEIIQNMFSDLEIQYLNQHVHYGSLIIKNNPIISELLTKKLTLVEKINETLDRLL